ncbi:MAG: oxygenase [Streptosporangiales bacterium]|nr:oxygenase [Streptosporangiales bacterium]
MDRTEVLVVGAGPTGLTLACGLLAQGVSVRVVDKATGPATTSRANILHARGVEVLDRTGVSGEHLPRNVAATRMSMYAGRRRLATMRFHEVDGARLSALFVSQADIEGVLRERLTELGGSIAWGTELTGLREDADGVTAELADGGALRAGWVAGCDGAHSAVRRLAGIAFPGVPVVERFLLADVHAAWDRDRTGSHAWFHSDGILLALPMRPRGEGPDDLWRLMADVTVFPENASPENASPENASPEDAQPDEEAILATFRRLLPERAAEHGVRIHGAEWTSVFRIQRRLAADYRHGRILLAGDAAHIHSPMGGQGIVTGMGDAENLAWKLALVAQGRADATLLDTYAAERRPLAAEVLRNITAQTRVLVGGTRTLRLLRDLVFVPITNLAPVQRRGTEIASQLWVTYRRGPLGDASRFARFARGVRPGDRMPDRPCTGPGGGRTRLYAVLREGWALLGPAGATATCAAVVEKCLGVNCPPLTPRTDAADATTEPGEVWLVRPDGHLAWRGAPDRSALERRLEELADGGRNR